MVSQRSALVLLIAGLVAHAYSLEHSQLIVNQHPANLDYDFASGSTLKLSDLKEILLAVNGFSSNKAVEWKGLKNKNPLAVPKVTFLFLTPSPLIENSLGQQSIKVEQDSIMDFSYLNDYYDMFKQFSSLPTIEEIKNFELDCMQDSIFYLIKLSESDSQHLNDSIHSVINSFSKNCIIDQKTDVLAYTLVEPIVLKAKRAVNDKATPIQNSITKIAVFYSDQYPAMFHLIFWTSLIMALALVGISCGMLSMDPGLDTVIYRMTSQRIKKDN